MRIKIGSISQEIAHYLAHRKLLISSCLSFLLSLSYLNKSWISVQLALPIRDMSFPVSMPLLRVKSAFIYLLIHQLLIGYIFCVMYFLAAGTQMVRASSRGVF